MKTNLKPEWDNKLNQLVIEQGCCGGDYCNTDHDQELKDEINKLLRSTIQAEKLKYIQELTKVLVAEEYNYSIYDYLDSVEKELKAKLEE